MVHSSGPVGSIADPRAPTTTLVAALAAGLAGVRGHLERAGAAAISDTPPSHFAADAPRPARLTAREAAVLRLSAAGQSNREMAATLIRSERTIERHLEHLYRKFAARNRAAAVALRHRLA